MKRKYLGSYLVLSVWTIFIVLIIGWVIYSSFKTNVEIFQKPWGLPSKITFENYYYAWIRSKMSLYFLNSIIVVITSVVVGVFISAMAAYILSRFNFKLRNVILTIFISGMAIPFHLLLVPLYRQLMNLNLIDTRIGLILVYVSLWLPFSIFVLTAFFKTIPREIEEAAVIDGCSEYLLYWKIMLPLARPGLITIAVFNFVGMWNEYLLALVFTSSKNLRTLSLGMYSLIDTMMYSANWGALFAAIVIMLIPAIIVFLTLQRYIIKGLTLGAIKG